MADGQLGACGALTRSEALSRLRGAWQVLQATPHGCGAARAAEKVVGEVAAAETLLRHAERDVRLWAAKCLAECFRILAPEPPLAGVRLRSALRLMLDQLRLLIDERSGGSLFVAAVGLLERLSEIRIFVLALDCDEAEEMLCALVEQCVAVARARAGASDGSRLEGLLVDLLVAVLGEADEVPSGVVAPLVQVLMEPASGNGDTAAGLARRVLGSLVNRGVALAVNSFLLEALGAMSADGEAASTSVGAVVALRAVGELYMVEPSLVARVLPRLLVDIQAADAELRRAVTAVVGSMLAHVRAGSGTDATSPFAPMAETHPFLVRAFLDRCSDADDGVRLAAIEGVAAILSAAAAVGGLDVAEKGGSSGAVAIVAAAVRVRQELADRCLDPSLAVRVRVVEVAAEVASSRAGLSLVAPVLPEIFRRILDKRALVREVCVDALGAIYREHALLAWAAGRVEDAEELAWAPQLLCEAYAVLAAGQLGHTSQLEEVVERCCLGCGEPDFGERQRALAFLGFFSSAAKEPSAARGLALLLMRKREANTALRRFVELRCAKGAPLLAERSAGVLAFQTAGSAGPSDSDSSAGALVCYSANGDACGQNAGATEDTLARCNPSQNISDEATVLQIVEAFIRSSPAAEEPVGPRPEVAAHERFRALDAVRDRALWTELSRLLSDPALATVGMQALLGELDKLLRVHRLEGFGPFLRRALLATWLLPDQARVLVSLCDGVSGGTDAAAAQALMSAFLRVVAEAPRFFPCAFAPHAGALVQRLSAVASGDEAVCFLRALAALGKRSGPGHEVATALQATDMQSLTRALLRVPSLLVDGVAAYGSIPRKAVRALGVLPASARAAAVEELLQWSEEQGSTSAVALRVVAACFAWCREQAADGQKGGSMSVLSEKWVTASRNIVEAQPRPLPELCSAAVEVLAAAGAEAAVGDACEAAGSPGMDAAVAALRAMRGGSLQLTTSLLSHLASQAGCALAHGEGLEDGGRLLGALHKLHKSGSRVRLLSRLRICVTLPALFAVASSKRLVDGAQRLMQAVLAFITRQCSAQSEPWLDVCVACFIHFLSRLDFFLAEANSSASAFPQSTRVAAFFVEALLRADVGGAAALASAALCVVGAMRNYVDRDAPESDALDKAAYVLRHVLEKRCPEFGGRRDLDGVRACMPAELFAARLIERVAPLALETRAASHSHQFVEAALLDDEAVATPTSTTLSVEAAAEVASPMPMPQSILRRDVTSTPSRATHAPAASELFQVLGRNRAAARAAAAERAAERRPPARSRAPVEAFEARARAVATAAVGTEAVQAAAAAVTSPSTAARKKHTPGVGITPKKKARPAALAALAACKAESATAGLVAAKRRRAA